MTYTLPDPLVCNDGSRVTNAETWFAKRRPEILEAYRAEIFGRSPDAGNECHFQRLGNFHQCSRRHRRAQAD